MQDQLPSEEIFQGKLIHVRVQTLAEPHGGTTRFEIVDHPDAVGIVAIREVGRDDPNGEPLVALVRQLRPAIGREMWEIPAGLVQPEEAHDPQHTAERELREETGAAAGAWQLLTREYVSPGFTTEAISIYLATGVTTSTADTPEDPTEIAAMQWVPFSEALARCASGEIQDGKTVLGLALARAALDPQLPRLGGEQARMFDPTTNPLTAPVPNQFGIATAENTQLDAAIKLDNALISEYNYASMTAYQAMDDRGHLFDRYLVLVAGIIAASIAALYQLNQIHQPSYIQPLMLGLFLLAGVLDIGFFIGLVRLRLAYHDSLVAMNTVKEYYIERFRVQVPDVEKAFRWRRATIPTGERFGSVTFVLAHVIALLGSIGFGAAAVIGLELAVNGDTGTLLAVPYGTVGYAIGALVGLILLVAQYSYFTIRLGGLKKHNPQAKMVTQ